MDDWPPRLKLLSILSTTRSLLERSNCRTLDDADSKEVGLKVDAVIDCLFYGKPGPIPANWDLLWSPTGVLQELAIINGWPDEYLMLAAEYDSLSHLVERMGESSST